MTARQISDGNDDGQILGQSSSDKLAFFGGTPAVQQTVTAVATGATAATIVTTLQALQAALDTYGLVSSS